MWNRFLNFFIDNKLITYLLLILLAGWGLVTAPFQWQVPLLPSDPVPVDAIPDIGENQQIVFTEWMGRSPQDVEDQITYPLTTTLLGLPGVKTVRSTSMFGFSSVYVIFEEDIDYYWSRTRILEKLNALPADLLPPAVQPRLGPDATALGQVFWYTLEGRDKDGKPTPGWDLHELRSIQDFYVKPALSAASGVAEVASVGGHIKEYQVDLDPQAMKEFGVSLMQVMDALRQTNRDVGAKTIEVNRVAYVIRGLGYVKSLEDIEETVIFAKAQTPIRVRDIAMVNIGPADRSMLGILDKSGAEATGGVVVARYGDNPMAVIDAVKTQISEIADGLPERELEDGRISKVTIVPFYDRTQLIQETLGTLTDAISLQILVTILVIVVMVFNLRTSLLIGGLLPVAVLLTFVMMRYTGVDANIVALSGIAIAIGTMVDLAIILNENIIRLREERSESTPLVKVVKEALHEVAPAILTAVATTIVSFLPVFTLQAAEGKLFSPLAWTKTYALVAALVFTLFFMPALAHSAFSFRLHKSRFVSFSLTGIFVVAGAVGLFFGNVWAGVVLLLFAINRMSGHISESWKENQQTRLNLIISGFAVAWLLALAWVPLGAGFSTLANLLFIGFIGFVVLGGFHLFMKNYGQILGWCLENKKWFLALPALLILLGVNIWLGFPKVFGFVANGFDHLNLNIRKTTLWSSMAHTFPGMQKEFMPALDEGAFLLMPTSMPHAGIEANKEVLQQLDMRVTAIPEVESVVGKAGRAETALDPAPMEMYENVILYKSEYVQDEMGRRVRFETNRKGHFKLKDGSWFDRENNQVLKDSEPVEEDGLIRALFKNPQKYLVEAKRGEYFRQWRDEIKTPDDIWNEISRVTNIPGVTSAPKLQPIETRLVMLQTGMRAPMGIKVAGPDLKTIENFSQELEKHLKEVPQVKAEAVFADRILGKPYLEIDWDREQLARYGLTIDQAQEYVETALGGMALTTTVEGRERFDIRLRYAREWRDNPEAIKRVLVATMDGVHIPLEQLAEVKYRPGPGMIRAENSFLTGYVLFDRKADFSEVSAVEAARDYLKQKTEAGELKVPDGVTYRFSGSYENQVRAEKRLMLVVPLSLVVIFLILYLQFRSVSVSLFIFSAIALAFSGGFIMLWLYGQDWFLNFSLAGIDFRELFQIRNYNLSVAVWVGFIALFGIATDDGVVMGTYLKQSFDRNPTNSTKGIREAVLEAGLRRVRPCLMTTATTLLALLPVLTSTGRGSDIMIPMAIPAFGGMFIALITLFVVPVLYSWREEVKLNYRKS